MEEGSQALAVLRAWGKQSSDRRKVGIRLPRHHRERGRGRIHREGAGFTGMAKIRGDDGIPEKAGRVSYSRCGSVAEGAQRVHQGAAGREEFRRIARMGATVAGLFGTGVLSPGNA